MFVLTLLLVAPTTVKASLNFGGSIAAPTGTTTYYEGNQKGGVGSPSNVPWRNSNGVGGNISFGISGTSIDGSTPLTFTESGATTSGFTNNASNFALEHEAVKFTIEIDYRNWAIDNSGHWYSTDGTIFQGASDINFTIGLINADGSLLWNEDVGVKMTLQAFGADDISLLDHNSSINRNAAIPNAAAPLSEENDFSISYGAGDNSVIFESLSDGGGDGLQADHVGHFWNKQSGTAGSGSDFVEVGRATVTFEFVDFNAADGIDSFAAGTVFGFSLDGSNFVAVPEPSSTALIALGGLALIIRRRN